MKAATRTLAGHAKRERLVTWRANLSLRLYSGNQSFWYDADSTHANATAAFRADDQLGCRIRASHLHIHWRSPAVGYGTQKHDCCSTGAAEHGLTPMRRRRQGAALQSEPDPGSVRRDCTPRSPSQQVSGCLLCRNMPLSVRITAGPTCSMLSAYAPSCLETGTLIVSGQCSHDRR
jgi:hypothetical protein